MHKHYASLNNSDRYLRRTFCAKCVIGCVSQYLWVCSISTYYHSISRCRCMRLITRVYGIVNYSTPCKLEHPGKEKGHMLPEQPTVWQVSQVWTTMTTPQEILGLVDNYHAQYSCHYRVIRWPTKVLTNLLDYKLPCQTWTQLARGSQRVQTLVAISRRY